MSLGEKLSKLRKENNYTQEQLADVLGVSRQSVSKWELNIAYPETDKLIYLSKLYNVSIDYIVMDSDNRSQDMSDEVFEEQCNVDYSSFIGSWCNIELNNWDIGYTMVAVIGQDKRYLCFCQTDRKKAYKIGFVLKRQIDAVTKLDMSEKKQKALPKFPEVLPTAFDPYDLLLGKVCDIQMHSPNLAAFILSTDGYQKALIVSADNNNVEIRDEGTNTILSKKDIVGIVES